MFQALHELALLYFGLSSRPDRIAKRFLELSSLLIVLSASCQIVLPDGSRLSIFPTIVISVSTSALAAALYSVSVALREAWAKKERAGMLKSLLSVGGSQERFVLVVPRFPKSLVEKLKSLINAEPTSIQDRQTDPPEPHIQDSDGQVQDTVEDEYGCVQSLLDANTDFAAEDDIFAAVHVLKAFADVQLKMPEIKTAAEVADELKNTRNTTYISIGLISNRLTMMVNHESPSRRVFEIVKLQTGKHAIMLATKEQDQNVWPRDLTNLERLDDASGGKKALVSKVVWPEYNVVVFILGGIDAPQTRKAAEYFQKNWDSIPNWWDPSLHKTIGHSAFAAVLSFRGETHDKTSVRAGDAVN